MEDQDLTLMLPKHTTPPQVGVTDSQMQNLLAMGAGAFATQRSSGPRLWEPPSVEMLQSVLPQYEITAFIARGGMGAVYKGTQRTLKRAVAIKVLPPEIQEGGDEMQFVERFKHEAQAMAQLSHPNIVAVFDAGETPDGLLYFVMEFVEGTDLAQLIASEGRIDPQQAVPIITAVCEALAFAHEEGIVHRDIKPSNIMIDRRGRVKVADFGLAKTVNVESTLMTRNDVAMGTPDFVAPEVLMPGMKVDGRADLYAVGVMLYQMLTGKIPRGRFGLPSSVIPQMDKGFDAIVDRAMQADRDKRYTTALEMKVDVERACSSGFRPSGGILSDGLKPELRTKSRNPRLLGIAAAALILLGSSVWFLMDEPPEAEGRAAGPPDAATAPQSGAMGQSALPAALEARAIRLWDSAAKLHKASGIRWEDEAMRLDQAGPTTGPESRNAILRASVRKYTGGHPPVLALRAVLGPDAQARLTVDFGRGNAYLSTSPGGVVIGKWSLPRAYGADEWVRVELRAIGHDFTVLVDGQEIGTAHSVVLSRPGKAMIANSGSGFFRDIVYIPLDDLSEAEVQKVVGVEAKWGNPNDE